MRATTRRDDELNVEFPRKQWTSPSARRAKRGARLRSGLLPAEMAVPVASLVALWVVAIGEHPGGAVEHRDRRNGARDRGEELAILR